MRHSSPLSVVSALAACLVSVGALAAPPATAEVGKPAPAFTLKDETGREHSLSQYKGKVVVLEWTNPECPFVQRHYEADTMQKVYGGAAGQQVVWLAIDSTHHNTPKKSAAWKQAEGFSWPVLQDADGRVGRLYGARTTPHMYVIDAQGVLRYAGAIDDDARGSKEAPTNHVRGVLEALKAGKAPATTSTTPYGCSVKYKG